MPARNAARKQRQRQHPTAKKQPANISAAAQKILADLNAAERSTDPAKKPEFFIDLTTVMLALHRWKDDPDVSTPSPYILQRIQSPDKTKSKAGYFLTAAQLQERVFAETVNLLNPQDVPLLLEQIASSLGFRLEHRQDPKGDEGAFQFIPLEPQPAAHDIPAIARKILIDLGVREASGGDDKKNSEFLANLMEVMRTLHVWRNDPNILPPAPYAFKIKGSTKAKPSYAFSGAQLQQRVFIEAAKLLSTEEVPSLFHEIALNMRWKLVYREEIPDYGAFEFLPLRDNSPTTPAPTHVIQHPEPQQHEQDMAQGQNIIVAKDGTLYKGGIPFRPLSEGAARSQAHSTTLARWIKNGTKFAGRPLDSYYFAPTHTYFLSEDSIQRAANRFVKWPSEEPAGPVTIGETSDKNGFLGMSEAADIAGVTRRTMWLWASRGKAPTDEPLDIIKCTASDYFYIRERDARALKKVVPRSGLQRGRRPQLALQP